MIVATFSGQKPLLRQATKNIAEKWGVTIFDFNDLPYWYSLESDNNTPFANPDNPNGWETGSGLLCPATVAGYEQARLSYDGLHPSNTGYYILADPFGSKMLNG